MVAPCGKPAMALDLCLVSDQVELCKDKGNEMESEFDGHGHC
jgi:hypothetical protein